MSSSNTTKEAIAARAGEKEPLLTDDADADNPEKDATILADAWDTLGLAVPIFLAMLSWVGMKTTDSALLGHVSAQALSAAALSDLWTMCTVVLINARILGVLCSAAVGAGNPKLAGVYLQVSYYVLSYVVLFVFVCWSFTETIWLWFGSDPELARMAGLYANVLAYSLPAQLAYGQLSQFFSSQRIMHPEVNASSVSLISNLVLGLVLVLGVGVPGWSGFGFKACPIVTTIVTYISFFVMWFVYCKIQKLHLECWDGWEYSAITWERIKTFCDLYVPAALGMASDFWRVAVIGTIAAKLGDLEVAIFNTSYRIMWIVLILISAIAGAASIKTTTRLGKMDPKGAKQASYVGIGIGVVVLLIVGVWMVSQIRLFGRIFTNDEDFLAKFEEAKWPFTVTLVLMNLSVAIERVPYSMGRTKIVFWMGFCASWGFQVPGVFFLTKYWRDDLTGLYWGMSVGYFVLTILYGGIVWFSDWKRYAEEAVARSEMGE